MKRTFTRDELDDLIDEGQLVETSAWRHGRKETWVFKADDGKHYRLKVCVAPEEGWQLAPTEECEEVREEERVVKVWVPVEPGAR